MTAFLRKLLIFTSLGCWPASALETNAQIPQVYLTVNSRSQENVGFNTQRDLQETFAPTFPATTRDTDESTGPADDTGTATVFPGVATIAATIENASTPNPTEQTISGVATGSDATPFPTTLNGIAGATDVATGAATLPASSGSPNPSVINGASTSLAPTDNLGSLAPPDGAETTTEQPTSSNPEDNGLPDVFTPSPTQSPTPSPTPARIVFPVFTRSPTIEYVPETKKPYNPDDFTEPPTAYTVGDDEGLSGGAIIGVIIAAVFGVFILKCLWDRRGGRGRYRRGETGMQEMEMTTWNNDDGLI